MNGTDWLYVDFYYFFSLAQSKRIAQILHTSPTLKDPPM